MLVAYLVSFLFYVSAQNQYGLTAVYQEEDRQLNQCVIGILNEYFTEYKELTYVNIYQDDEGLLKTIHSTINFSLISRRPTQQMFVPNLGYLVSTTDVEYFVEYFKYLMREPAWNPYARFLIVIRSIQIAELTLIFNEFLRLRVNNVLVLNATDGHLYTYNPYDNYACGKYYDTIISYGLCSQTTENLFPNKLVTELKNCHFTTSLPHRPPFTIDPSITKGKITLLGVEEYIIRLLGEKSQFTVSFNYSYDSTLFSTVTPNMTAIGPMEKLQKKDCDIIFGSMLLISSRVEAFSFLCGYHDYSNELRFAVKTASAVSTWKYIYLEFEFDVWILLLVALVIYSFIVVILLHSADRGDVVLRLLDNLLLHGREVRTRMSVKCVLMTWAWFAYLINTFYQSNLFSFTTNPIIDFQVSKEEDIMNYDFKPCFSKALQIFLTSETSKFSQYNTFGVEGCSTATEALTTVSKTEKMFTIIPNYLYLYHQRQYNDKTGKSLVYYFEKPFTKFLLGYFFQKGFPITKSLRLNALRLRENGLVDKILNDHYYSQKLKRRDSPKEFSPRFLCPWSIYFAGLAISTFTFIIELLYEHKKLPKMFTCKLSHLWISR